VGLLSDLLVPRFAAESLRYALIAPVCLLPIMAGVLLAIVRTLPGDLRLAGVLVDDIRGSIAAAPSVVHRES